jgi:hypothetical protein
MINILPSLLDLAVCKISTRSYSFRKHARSQYPSGYWPRVHGQSSIGGAVNRLISAITGALNQAIPFSSAKKLKYPGRF